MSDVTPSALELARRWHQSRTSSAALTPSDLDAFHREAAAELEREIGRGDGSLGVSLEVADDFRPLSVRA